MYARVDESDTDYNKKTFQMVMVEGMTGINSYTNAAFGDMSVAYVGQWKSGTIDSTTHPWVIAGDHRTLVILNCPQETANGYADVDWSLSYHGDTFDLVYGSNYPQASCPGMNLLGFGGSFYNGEGRLYALTSLEYGSHAFLNVMSATVVYGDVYRPWRMMRDHAGNVGKLTAVLSDPVGCGLLPDGTEAGTHTGFGYYPNSSNIITNTMDTYPDPIHGGFNMARPLIVTGSATVNVGADMVRGELKGVWTPQHRRISGWESGDMFRGSGQMSGKVFEVFLLNGFTDTHWLLLEVSDTWDS